MNRQNDTETLVESFCTLADEVQGLIDRKTILEHKLRFAAEQYQQLADKYAPAAPEISETLAKLQLPPDFHRPSISGTYVPLPKRGQTGCNQHQIALLIRDGRRAVQQLSLRNSAAKSVSNKDAASAVASSPLSTIMEQDFTVEGKKGMLQCPFSAMKREQQQQRQQEALQQLHLQRQQQQHKQQQQDQQQQDQQQQDQQPSAATQPGGSQIGSPGAKPADMVDSTPHNSADPICAAMVEEVKSQTAPSSAGAVKCPIRFMDQHSAEEIAHYVETHKHELPRSHAICLRRYNKNEEQIRKLDAKYGNLVNMISGLGQLHQPMLPSAEGEGTEQADRAELHRTSNERVENWAQTVSVIAAANEGPEQVDGDQDSYERRSRSRSRSGSRSSRDRTRTQSLENHDNAEAGGDGGGDGDGADTERESHFDRPLKEVRLGESPSRPWGIAVPLSSLPNAEAGPPLSPPAAPVRMPSPQMAGRCPVSGHAPASGQPAKCPFGAAAGFPPPHGLGFEDGKMPAQPAEKGQTSVPPKLQMPQMPQMPQIPQMPPMPQMPQMPLPQMPQMPSMAQAAQAATAQMPSTASYQHGPAFVNFTPPTTASKTDTNAPQMLFTGPVFIGYSIEQAAQFMQYFQSLQK